MLDEDTGQLQVEASDGLDRPGYRVSYQLGEGITGRVVESGKPIVVPQISREPMFLNRASKRAELPQQELSFICVPIMLNRKAVGALGVDLQVQARPRLRPHAEVPRRRRVDDLAGGQGAAPDRQRAQEAARREHAPAPGAARALRLLEPPRHQRPDAADLRAGGAGRADDDHGADPRRVGHRQGADRARDSLQLAAREQAVRQGELRGAAREPDRVGAVRLREGRVHRRAAAEEGALRAGRGRHAVPRRNRRHQPGHAGQAAARAAGARVRAPRRHRDAEVQRAADRGHQQGPREGDRRRARSARISTTG